MTQSKIELSEIIIEEFSYESATRETIDEFHAFNEKLHLEINPENKLRDREIVEKELQYDDSNYFIHRWFVYKSKTNKKLIGVCDYRYSKKSSEKYEHNKEIGFVEIYIEDQYRNQGLGTKLLHNLLLTLKKEGCRYANVSTTYPSGKSFFEKYYGKIINIESYSRLLLKDVDWDLVDRWIEDGKKRNPEVTIDSFYGVSEAKIEEYCQLLTDLENEKPTLNSDNDKRIVEIITPKSYREFIIQMENKDYFVYTIRTIEQDGKISGLTELFYSERNNPEKLEQGLTGVKSIYRGKGLGKWLKALMLKYIKEKLPQAKYWITGNANHNEPMLAINQRLGFKRYIEKKSFQFVIDDLLPVLEKEMK